MANDALNLLCNQDLYSEFSVHAINEAKKYDILKVLPLYEQVYKQALDS